MKTRNHFYLVEVSYFQGLCYHNNFCNEKQDKAEYEEQQDEIVGNLDLNQILKSQHDHEASRKTEMLIRVNIKRHIMQD